MEKNDTSKNKVGHKWVHKFSNRSGLPVFRCASFSIENRPLVSERKMVKGHLLLDKCTARTVECNNFNHPYTPGSTYLFHKVGVLG